MRLFYILSLAFITSYASAQSNIKINEDALKYFNSYLTNKSVIDDVKGELTYDKYSNELHYKSTTIMYENPTTEKDIYFKMTGTFSIPIADLNKIEEIIVQKGEIIIVQYKFHLNKKVKRTIETKEKGKWLDKEQTYEDVVFISPSGSINLTDLTKIKKVFRDIFMNIDIESKIDQR